MNKAATPKAKGLADGIEVWCSFDKLVPVDELKPKAFLNKSNSGNIAFRLDYEKGIRIGDFQDKPKVQKYNTEEEFHQLWTPHFRSV